MSGNYAKMKPRILRPKPSVLLSFIGGAVGAIAMSAVLYCAPVYGWPVVDYPRLLGGIFTGNPTGALALGYILFLFFGLVFAMALNGLWVSLPGDPVAFRGAALKGTLFGAGAWVVSGLLFPVFGAWNQLFASDLARPGFFGWSLGAPALLTVLFAHLAYGITTSLIAAMGQGITEPLDLLGWPTYRFGDLRGVWKEHAGK